MSFNIQILNVLSLEQKFTKYMFLQKSNAVETGQFDRILSRQKIEAEW